jgi:uncharacterized protein YecT (DUF1311 family)
MSETVSVDWILGPETCPMMSATRLLSALALVIACRPGAAHAADCAQASDQATMNRCATEEYQRADAALNGLYKQVQQRLKDDDVQMKRLIAAERAWVSFRDLECKFESAPSGGSASEMALATCLSSLTSQRSAALKGFLACPEGDLSCPLPPK